MRTLTEEDWIRRERIIKFFGGERRYEVCGSIAFEFDPFGADPDLTKFANAIGEIDSLFPWDDEPCPAAGPRSIHCLSDGEVVVHDSAVQPRRIYWFHIWPAVKFVRKGQVYAYEKYLAKIAEELAKKKLPGVSEVRSVIEVRAVSSFKA